DHALLVRSYDVSAAGTLMPLTSFAPEAALRRQNLRALAIPYVPAPEGESEEPGTVGGIDVVKLLAEIPGLRAKLDALSKYPQQLLSSILKGSARTDEFAAEDAILVGGDPQLIQGPHEPECSVCHQRMRFLLQFRDVTDDYELGDCGVGYVYGCDSHPERCDGFVDCF